MGAIGKRRLPFTSPRSRGEVGSPLAIRVRGILSAFLCLLYSLIEAPHPNPLPARAGRGGVRHTRRH
jgi:hypothetical protein